MPSPKPKVIKLSKTNEKVEKEKIEIKSLEMIQREKALLSMQRNSESLVFFINKSLNALLCLVAQKIKEKKQAAAQALKAKQDVRNVTSVQRKIVAQPGTSA